MTLPPTDLEPGISLDQQSRALLAIYDDMKEEWATRVAEGGMSAYRAFADAVFDRFRGQHRDIEAAETIDLTVPGAHDRRPARLYRPASAKPLPLLLFFHGGGWSLGGLDSYAGLASSIAALSGCAVLAVDYRLAPEHPFPAGLDDCLAATRHVLDHAVAYGADPARVGVMGDSAGGNLAAVVARDLAASGDTRLRAQILIYPMIDVASADERFLSRGLYGQGRHFLATSGIHFARDTYLSTGGVAADDPRVTVLDAPVPRRIADAVILTAGHDPLRDEGAAYHRRLVAAGATSRYLCESSTIHAFVSFGVLDVAQSARRAIAAAITDLLNVRP